MATEASGATAARQRRSQLARAGLVTLVLAAAAALALLASACGGSSGEGVAQVETTETTTTSSDAPSANGDAVAFARCIRRHGVNMPDPNPEIQWGQLDQHPRWDAAFQACRQLLPPQPTPPPPSAQEMEQLLTYAACMRAHDAEISDPDPTGDMTSGHATRAQAENDPVFKAAHAACKDKLPGSLQPGSGARKPRR